MTPHIPLHTHSHYSLLQALPKIHELVAKAKEAGMKAIALTDNGNLYGALEFYKECKKAGIKPILGVDGYLAIRTRHDKQSGIDNKRHRLILLAKNNQGYRNLIKLVTLSHLEGFYYKPRMDRELLEAHSEGLIAIMPALGGEITAALRVGDKEKAANTADWYRKLFGNENFFLEITRHDEMDGNKQVVEDIVSFSNETKIPLVAGNEVYYLEKDEKKARTTLLSVQNGGEQRGGFGDDGDFHFLDNKEIEKRFSKWPDAISNTQKIAGMCDLSLALGKWNFPKFEIAGGKSADDELREEVFAGFGKRAIEKTTGVIERVEYELKVIKDKGYAPYFLVVSDLLDFAHSKKILTTIRGSVAGSLVTYLAGITNVNPIEYKLPFERFLNPERPSAPDIDMDYADNRRDEMIEYAKSKYGADKVAQIGTFGTMMARGSVRDVARALGYEYGTGDKIAKLIPFGSQGFPMSIERGMEMAPELKALYKQDKDVKAIIDMAMKIEGCARHISVHAAGVVIAPTPLTDFVPLQFDPKGEGKIITQYDMHAVEDAGLLKFDFLGIRNLSILADAVERVKQQENVDIDIENIPLDDKKTFEMLAKGETIGLFQLNGAGMTRYLKDLRPSTIHDINAMVALYRPGPMESIPKYIERKHNPRLVTYLDNRMKEILDQSYGVLTYQDDVMMVAIKLAGYRWLEADKLRKAMGKKIPAEMEAQKEKLVNGFIKHGMTTEKAKELWTLIEPFAAYGFNKCVTGDTRLLRISDTPNSNLSGNAGNAVRTRSGERQTVNFQYADTEVKKIRHGDKIAAFDKETGRIVIREVKEFVDMGIKPVWKITTSSGKAIKATGNHPFFCRIINNRRQDQNSEKYRIGIFVDNANLFYGAKLSGWKIDIRKIAAAVKPYFNISFINYYLAVPDTKDKSFAPTMEFINKIKKHVTIKTKPLKYINGGQIKKGDVDMEIALDVARTYQGLDVIMILTGDSDYAELKSYAKERGKKIIFAGYDASTSWKLRQGKYVILDRYRNEIELHPEKTTPKPELGRLLLDTLYADRPSKSNGQWVHAEDLSLSQEIAAIRINHAVFWDKIKTIEKLPAEQVYDIEVAGVHTFIGNNIVTHNSHAASYGKVAYQTAYMKANFPAIYMAAVLTADSGDVEKIGEIIAECKRMGIPVLPPDVNESQNGFTVVKSSDGKQNTIRFGLMTIKNFGEGISRAIILERESNGKFKSLMDFLQRIKDRNLNKKSLEALVKCGALDAFGERGQLLGNMDTLLNFNKESARKPDNQISLFGNSGGGGVTLRLEKTNPLSKKDLLAWEKELLGLYLSGHPLDAFREIFQKRNTDIAKTISTLKEGMTAVIGGIIEEAKAIVTKGGEQMAFIKIADFSGSIEVVVFPRTYEEFKTLLNVENCVAVKGKISNRNGEISLIADKFKKLG